MAVLSVDLAYKRYRDIGVVVLREVGDQIRCELVDITLAVTPTPACLADFLDKTCVAQSTAHRDGGLTTAR